MPFHEKLSGKPVTLADSVARNLQAVLNAKQGYASPASSNVPPGVEVFGLGRYDGHYAQKALVDALIAEMLAKVTAFEPRLSGPSITLQGRDRMLWVRFLLTGRCNEAPCSFVIFFHSVFRHVKVVSA